MLIYTNCKISSVNKGVSPLGICSYVPQCFLNVTWISQNGWCVMRKDMGKWSSSNVIKFKRKSYYQSYIGGYSQIQKYNQLLECINVATLLNGIIPKGDARETKVVRWDISLSWRMMKFINNLWRSPNMTKYFLLEKTLF